MNAKKWLIGYIITALIIFTPIAAVTYHVDPFFHFHRPYTDRYFYEIDNQRYQNDGICRHFDGYTGMITGTSMIENFKTSDMDALFGTTSIKIPNIGAYYKETDHYVSTALAHNPELKTVIRCLDMNFFLTDKDAKRTDLGKYPTYLYDHNPLNDAEYLLNKEVLLGRVVPMIQKSRDEDTVPGLTDFDKYSSWLYYYGTPFGKDFVLSLDEEDMPYMPPETLSEKDKKMIRENIEQNILSTAQKYKDTTFYLFFSPYSAAWWKTLNNAGALSTQLEIEKYVIELLLSCENIRLYSFNNFSYLTTDLNQYKDMLHYGGWVNEWILYWIRNDVGLITAENYEQYCATEREIYTNYDYSLLYEQADYADDYFPAALGEQWLYGVEPLDLLTSEKCDVFLDRAVIAPDYINGSPAMVCTGTLTRDESDETPLEEYLNEKEYVGARIEVHDETPHRFLTFLAKKEAGDGQPIIYIYGKKGEILCRSINYTWNINNEWTHYTVDISTAGVIDHVIINGGYFDTSGSPDSTCSFSEVILY